MLWLPKLPPAIVCQRLDLNPSLPFFKAIFIYVVALSATVALLHRELGILNPSSLQWCGKWCLYFEHQKEFECGKKSETFFISSSFLAANDATVLCSYTIIVFSLQFHYVSSDMCYRNPFLYRLLTLYSDCRTVNEIYVDEVYLFTA